MKKQFLYFMAVSLLSSSTLFAIEFYGVLNPIKSFAVKGSISGEVVFVNKSLEKSFIKNSLIIKLDDKVDMIELEQTKIKLNNLKEMRVIESELLDSYNKVSSKTKMERDAQKIKVLSMESSIADMEIKIATLKNNIAKKNIKLSNIYLSSIEVEVGDFISSGGLLYKAFDLSKGKIELFIPIKEIDNIKNKIIHLNGEKTNLKISKISKVADEKNISAYKVEIIINNPKIFSKLVKVEFK